MAVTLSRDEKNCIIYVMYPLFLGPLQLVVSDQRKYERRFDRVPLTGCCHCHGLGI